MRGPESAQVTDQHKWIGEIWIGEIENTVLGRWPLVVGQTSVPWVQANDQGPRTNDALQIGAQQADNVVGGDDTG